MIFEHQIWWCNVETLHRHDVSRFASSGKAFEGSSVLKGAQEYSGVFRSARGYSARAILEAPGGPKTFIFAYSSSGFTVFEKPRISRKQVAKLLLRFWEIRKWCFCQQTQCFFVFC